MRARALRDGRDFVEKPPDVTAEVSMNLSNSALDAVECLQVLHEDLVVPLDQILVLFKGVVDELPEQHHHQRQEPRGNDTDSAVLHEPAEIRSRARRIHRNEYRTAP